jgi:hypothetical protein
VEVVVVNSWDDTLVVVTVTPALLAQLVVSAASLASVFLAGRRTDDGGPRFPHLPWLLLAAGHGAFLVYAVVTGQPGFLPLNVGMVVAALVNLRAARRAADRGGEPDDADDAG